jgi:hypothetical protein
MIAKLVNESLNFEKKSDPLVSLGVGQKALISKWLGEMDVINYIINDDLTIDVKGHADFYGRDLYKFPDYIQFNKIFQGYFSCSGNYLTSLRGCPLDVNGDFYCDDNRLTSLEGCPLYVNGSFFCAYNTAQFTKEDVKKLCKVSSTINI